MDWFDHWDIIVAGFDPADRVKSYSRMPIYTIGLVVETTHFSLVHFFFLIGVATVVNLMPVSSVRE